jgi:hypothetical protein
LWFSTNTQGKLAVVGWVNTAKYWQTGDAAASQDCANETATCRTRAARKLHRVQSNLTTRIKALE